MKKITFLFILLVISGCSTSTLNNNYNNQQNIEIVCTMDAMECPDGSYVGRVTPDCDFAPCPEIVEESNEKNIEENKLVEPIEDFYNRITKKEFGQYITKQNSPVQPERFSGYHTGVDIEYVDTEYDVPVVSIADGTVVLSRWVSGYGGVTIIKHEIKGIFYYVIYGHLDPDSILNVNKKIKQGERIGILGEDKSNETDGERKHLHFAIYKGNKINLLGYVQNQGELKNWIDPIDFFAEHK